jgi:SET domain-containing protein
MNNSIEVREAGKMGRGVFATAAIAEGETIESCPVICLPARQGDLAQQTVLQNYFFGFGRNQSQYAIALGYGSLYNHSADPNADFTQRQAEKDIIFRATRPIREGEQIFIDYGWSEEDAYELH